MPESSNFVRTNCRLCGYLCGLIAQVEDGRVVSVEPDPSRYPYDAGIMKGCQRNHSILEILDHPQRINYPLKRLGERGSGKWERIPWNQALYEISERLEVLKERYGPETLATSIGGPHTAYWPLHRFLNMFGSPNNIGIGQMCWNPAIWVNTLTFGWPLENELDPANTACAIILGMNPAESDNSLFWRTILEFTRLGGKVVVIDPRYTRTAGRATHWLPIKPGTDCALALGLLHVILEEKLYDLMFIEKWCQGFESVRDHVAPYTPELVAGITGLTAQNIIEVARLYAAQKPATIITGRGIDQIGANSVPTHRALAILRAVTGNVDLPGATHLGELPDLVPETDLELSERLPEAQRQKQLGGDRLLLQSYPGFERVARSIASTGKRLPKRYLTSAHPNLVWRAMLDGEPYPVRAMIVMASNPLLSQADTSLIYRALKSLDLLVVLEYFKTPTAMLADYILPGAGVLERPVLQINAGTANIAYGGAAAVQPYYERHADYDLWRELGCRLGQAADWPWQTFEESLQAILKPTGLSWQDFCETGLYCPPYQYHKYAQIDPATGAAIGFSTPSGKIELFSTLLANLGNEPLPDHKLLAASSPEYPLQLISGARFQPYYASAFRQVKSLRALHPHPWAEVSAKTAARLGLEEGSPVWVETPRGKARFVLKIAEMRDELVSVEYGWWYPELPASEPILGGVWISNANLLTHADFETCDPLIGQWCYNGLPCRMVRAQSGFSDADELHELEEPTGVVQVLTENA